AELARARGRASAREWARAATAWDEVQRPYRAGLARWREAEALVADGDRSGATAAAQSALDAARAVGSDWLAGEVRGLAGRARLQVDAQAGADAPKTPSDGPDDPFGLTPRERQVLTLVAQGATNRQIGGALYMAEKTASVHVSRILAKLDVHSRTQAAAVAHRLGLA
ncbi:MAG: response regulator transcription factor, partial [Solirubrobacteraceae bacterium]